MRTTERVFLYSAVASLGVAALYHGTAPATALAPRTASDLGPADALTLSGKDAKSNLVLRNADEIGRAHV